MKMTKEKKTKNDKRKNDKRKKKREGEKNGAKNICTINRHQYSHVLDDE